MSDRTLYEVQVKVNEDDNFRISRDNMQEFFKCEDIKRILEENNVKYQAQLKDGWHGGFRFRRYHIKLIISIQEEDYKRIKEYLVPKSILIEEEEEYIPAKVVGYIKEGLYIFTGILMLGLGIAISLKIRTNIESIITGISIAIIGVVLLLYRINKYLIKRENKKS